MQSVSSQNELEKRVRAIMEATVRHAYEYVKTLVTRDSVLTMETTRRGIRRNIEFLVLEVRQRIENFLRKSKFTSSMKSSTTTALSHASTFKDHSSKAHIR